MDNEEKNIIQDLKRRNKFKKNKMNLHLDEASQLHRRARNLLVKLKLEQNLIDAYCFDGWKGQSREKIRPEKELQRAKTQILRCKLGIRNVIHQLELLSSSGQIDESFIFPDGSVHHDHIYCAKCKLKEAFEDNDIILCDGTCNCAFHQKCLDPPLATEDIPSGDQGWFCKFCDCKLEIVEAINAHVGTQFSANDTWKDIFREASLPNKGTTEINPEEEWPDSDSEDNDYDPLRDENSNYDCISIGVNKSFGECSSGSISSLESEDYIVSGCSEGNTLSCDNSKRDASAGLDTDEALDEIFSGRRRRYAVDYRKLYDEMFGKDPNVAEQVSEDEDWGPPKRRQRGKESLAASTLLTSLDCEERPSELPMKVEESAATDPRPRKHLKRRIPVDAVEKLRQVFMENELPSREIKQQISQQLSLEYGQVNKWFKNARYMSLRTKNVGIDISEDMCLKRHLLLLKAKRRGKKKVCFVEGNHEAELLMEQLHQIETKLWRLKQFLLTLEGDGMNLSTEHVVYFPVAELKEKIRHLMPVGEKEGALIGEVGPI